MSSDTERESDGRKYLTRYEFGQFTKSVENQLAAGDKRMEALHESIHTLRNVVAPVPFLQDKLEDLVSDLKNVPRREDLANLSGIITSKFNDFEKQRAKDEAAASQRINRVLVVLGLLMPVLVFILNAMGKRLGLF